MAIVITKQPENVAIPLGSTAIFSVEAQGEGLIYQWQWYGSGGYWGESGLPTARTATLEVPGTADRNGQSYRCVIKDASGNQAVSNAATLTLLTIIITKQPRSYRGPLGLTPTFSVEAQGEGLNYQWKYSRDNGAHWSNLDRETATTSELIFTDMMEYHNGYLFRCDITDANGNMVMSDAALLIVDNGKVLLIRSNTLKALANAIRVKNGTTEEMTLFEIVISINEL